MNIDLGGNTFVKGYFDGLVKSPDGFASTAMPPLWGYFGFPLNKTGISVGVGKDGHNFSVVPTVPYSPPDGGSARDVNLVTDYDGRPQRWNGLYYIVYTAGGFGGVPYWSIASTPDFKTWTHVKDVMVTGGGFNTVTTTGTASASSTTLTVASGTGITVGMKACQSFQTTGLGGLFTVTAISGSTVTLSAPTTGAVSGTIYFFNGNNTWSPFANMDASGTLRVFFRISTTPGNSYAPPGIGYMTCSDPGTFNTWSNYTAVSGLDNNLNGPWIVRQGNTYYFFGDKGGAPDGHSDIYYYTSTAGVTGPYTAVGFLNGGNWSAYFGQNVESVQIAPTGANSLRCYLANQGTGQLYWSETTSGLNSTSWSMPVAVGFDDGMGLAAGCIVSFQNTDDQVTLLSAALGDPQFFHFRNTNNNLPPAGTNDSLASITVDGPYLKLGPTNDGTGTMYLQFNPNQAGFGGGPLYTTNDVIVGGELYSGRGHFQINDGNANDSAIYIQNLNSSGTTELGFLNASGTKVAALGISYLYSENADFAVNNGPSGVLNILFKANGEVQISRGNVVVSNLIYAKGIYLQDPSSGGFSQAGFLDNSGTLQGTVGYGNTGALPQIAGKNYLYSTGPDWVIANGSSSPICVVIMSGGNVGDLSTIGNLIASIAGKGIQIKEGANGRSGTATLVAGTVTIANSTVTANSRIMITRSSLNSSPALGELIVIKTAGTGFTVNSYTSAGAAAVTDVSSFDYIIVEGI